MTKSPAKVDIYADGACSRNPGPGGYGVVLVHGNRRKEVSVGFRLTTNSRMEIMAAIVGLRSLKTRCLVTLYSDSKYLVDSMRLEWARRWRANGWRRNKKEKAQNPGLWEDLLGLCDDHEVEFVMGQRPCRSPRERALRCPGRSGLARR